MPETPPSGGIPQVPTIGTISRQLQGVAGQLHGARNDLDTVLERQKAMGEDVARLRQRLLDGPVLAAAGVALATDARPSMAVQAAQKAAGFGKYSLIIIGALGVAAQIAAQFRPGLVGPIQVLIELLGGKS